MTYLISSDLPLNLLMCQIHNPPIGFDIIKTYKLPQGGIINPYTGMWILSIINIHHTHNVTVPLTEFIDPQRISLFCKSK